MIIYKATSKTTGKIYIGLTSQTLSQRISQHKSQAEKGLKTHHFYNAIKKYGFDDFIFEIVEDDIADIALLNEREKFWISFYNSYEEGYNSTRGGDGRVTRDDELIIKLFLEGKTVKEICELTGHNRSTIYKSFQINGLTEENNKKKGTQIAERCARAVEQYDLTGKLIQTFSSASEAARLLKGNQGAISCVCRREPHYLSYLGFLFKYSDDEESILAWVERYNTKQPGGKKKKQILQLNENYDIISIYESGADAAKALGKKDKSNICRAAREEGKAYGYYWKYTS